MSDKTCSGFTGAPKAELTVGPQEAPSVITRTLIIHPTRHGGFVVLDGGSSTAPGFATEHLYAGSLEDCLEFVRVYYAPPPQIVDPAGPEPVYIDKLVSMFGVGGKAEKQDPNVVDLLPEAEKVKSALKEKGRPKVIREVITAGSLREDLIRSLEAAAEGDIAPIGPVPAKILLQALRDSAERRTAEATSLVGLGESGTWWVTDIGERLYTWAQVRAELRKRGVYE